MKKAMTREQFLEYAREYLEFADESIAEHETQYRFECALFGDAGPGQGLRLNEMRAEAGRVRRQYERLLATLPR